MNGDIIYIHHEEITVENFEDNLSETIAVGSVADAMTRRDAAWWNNHYAERTES